MVGYFVVSTSGQLDALKKYGVERIYDEKITGTKKDRPELDELLSVVKSGDTIVVESLSRLGRSTKDLMMFVDCFAHQLEAGHSSRTARWIIPTGETRLDLREAIGCRLSLRTLAADLR